MCSVRSNYFLINYFNFDICRICLQIKRNLLSIYEKDIMHKLKLCTHLQFTENDKLPSKICGDCLEELSQASNFADKCAVNDGKLKKYAKQLKDSQRYTVSEFIIANLLQFKKDIIHASKCPFSANSYGNTAKLSTSINNEKVNKLNKTISISSRKKSFIPRANQNRSANLNGNLHNNVNIGDPVSPENFSKQNASSEAYRKIENLTDSVKVNHPPNVFADKYLTYPCKICGRNFKRYCALKNHLGLHEDLFKESASSDDSSEVNEKSEEDYEENTNNSIAKQKNYNQTVSNKSYRQTNNRILSKTQIKDKRTIECNTCQKTFANRNNLKVHERIHTGENPYKCQLCPKEFSHMNSFQVHKRFHSGERPYKCTVCSKAFVQTGNLLVHQRVHTGVRPYKCEECPKQFSTKRNLVIHKRMHTGERPYQCGICSKYFTQLHSLKRHNKIHLRIVG